MREETAEQTAIRFIGEWAKVHMKLLEFEKELFRLREENAELINLVREYESDFVGRW